MQGTFYKVLCILTRSTSQIGLTRWAHTFPRVDTIHFHGLPLAFHSSLSCTTIFACCTVIPLIQYSSRSSFTPGITSQPFTVHIYSLFSLLFSVLHFLHSPNHLTHWSVCPANFLETLIHTFSFFILSLHVTIHMLLKHFFPLHDMREWMPMIYTCSRWQLTWTAC